MRGRSVEVCFEEVSLNCILYIYTCTVLPAKCLLCMRQGDVVLPRLHVEHIRSGVGVEQLHDTAADIDASGAEAGSLPHAHDVIVSANCPKARMGVPHIVHAWLPRHVQAIACGSCWGRHQRWCFPYSCVPCCCEFSNRMQYLFLHAMCQDLLAA